MRVEDLEYELPEELIAQHPAPRRDDSRLLVFDRSTGAIRHKRFRDLSEELHGERYEVSREEWARISAARRVLAVGTTTVRVLETLARGAPLTGRTSLFVTPGFRFERVDALLTNFHLPRSTLLALVMAFAGVEETRWLYELAIAERYRFYSFGDATLIR